MSLCKFYRARDAAWKSPIDMSPYFNPKLMQLTTTKTKSQSRIGILNYKLYPIYKGRMANINQIKIPLSYYNCNIYSLK